MTKTFWYPIIKKIMNQIGVKITKTTFAKGISKAVPVVGGVISGTLNFTSMMPMANRLNEVLDKATFDYSESDYKFDIEEISNIKDVELEKKEKDISNVRSKVSKELIETKKSVSNLISSKIGKKKEKVSDPYDEIKKLKELLDMNIISQEEFNKKKKELLNI